MPDETIIHPAGEPAEGAAEARATDEAAEPATTLRQQLSPLLPVVVGALVLLVIGQTVRWMMRALERRLSQRHPLAGIGEQLALGRRRARR